MNGFFGSGHEPVEGSCEHGNERKWLSSGVLRRVVWYKLTNVSDVFTASIITLMMEAVSTSEMSVNFYHTKLRNIPEDSHIHTHRRQNLKYHHGNEPSVSIKDREFFK
jgi:hypothetical protein